MLLALSVLNNDQYLAIIVANSIDKCNITKTPTKIQRTRLGIIGLDNGPGALRK